MKILVIHQVPYVKIDYRRGLDHDRHDVTYIGHSDRMADLPADLRCQRIELDPAEDIVAGVIARTSPTEGFGHLLALSEFGILQAREVRRHLGLPGPSLAQVEAVRDKVVMKQRLAGSGVRFPRFAAAPVDDRLPWTGRTVLKPRRGASSDGVSIHGSAAEALVAYQKLDDGGDYQFEEFVDGALLHLDGLVSDGRLVDLAVSRYVNQPVDYADGLPLGSHQIALDERHRLVAEQVVSRLDIEAGCLHLELFDTPDGELVFLEVANRMGGAGVLNAHLRHTGIHLPAHEIAIRLGLPRPAPDQPSGRYHGWLVFPGHHLIGTGHQITVPRPLRDHPCLDRLFTLPPDRALPDHITYHEWLAPVFIEASHHDEATLAAFLHECASTITVDVGSPL